VARVGPRLAHATPAHRRARPVAGARLHLDYYFIIFLIFFYPILFDFKSSTRHFFNFLSRLFANSIHLAKLLLSCTYYFFYYYMLQDSGLYSLIN
jgi:hypothetical protein